MAFEKIKSVLRSSSCGMQIEKLIRATGAVHALHTVQMERKKRDVLGGGTNEFVNYYESHEVEFRNVYDILDDEFSKKTYSAVIDYRRTYDIKIINPVIVQPQYFLKNLLPPQKEYECLVDGGAFIGDTGMRFLSFYTEAKRTALYLWECNINNIRQIKKNLRTCSVYTVEPYAMWDKEETLSFEKEAVSSTGAVAEGNGSIVVNANAIDNIHANDRITFIKMDIEGAEIHALNGAKRSIQEQRPKLAICIYHTWEHLHEIPLLIKSWVPEYKIFIRHHSDTFSETVMYACL